jgi:hypothetical protein
MAPSINAGPVELRTRGSLRRSVQKGECDVPKWVPGRAGHEAVLNLFVLFVRTFDEADSIERVEHPKS